MEISERFDRDIQYILSCENLRVERESSFAVIYKLVPFLDGDSWCVLLGEDLQAGIAGFGDSPEQAIIAFEVEMTRKRGTDEHS